MKVMTQFHERLRAQAETSQLAIRWRGLPARDRLALLWLGAFLLLVVLYLALWRPAERHLQSARQYFTEQRALHAYIQQQAPNVRQADAAAPQAQIDPSRVPHGCDTPAERVRGSGRRSGELLLQSGRQPPTLRPSVGIPRGNRPDGRDASDVAVSGRGRCKSLRGSAYQALHSCSNSQVRSSALFTMRSFPSFTDGSTPR